MEITTGQGLQFKWNGTTYFIGNRKLFREQNIPIDMPEEYLQSEEEKGQTAVMVGDTERVLGIISISEYRERRYEKAHFKFEITRNEKKWFLR